MAASAYEQGVQDRIRFENNKARNAAQQSANDSIAKRREVESEIAQEKMKAEVAQRAIDFARQNVVKSLIAKGTNNVNAWWEAGKIIPFSKISDQIAVENAHEKANIPTPRFGAAQMDIGGKTVYGQTNNAGRFFQISPPIPKDPTVEVQNGEDANSKPVYQKVPASRVPAVIATLPPEARTNQFNVSAMASLPPAPTPSGGVSNPTPIPAVTAPATPAPDTTTPIPANPTVSPDLTGGASAAVTAPAVSTAPAKQFKDKTGTVWSYVGTATDPSTDRNPSSWQPAQ